MEKLTEEQRKWAKIYAKHELTAAYIKELEQELQETKALLESAKRDNEIVSEHLRQAYVGMKALNEELKFK